MAAKLAIACLLMIAGCAPNTIHPIYTDQDLIFDPALLGMWVDPDSPDESLQFTAAGSKSYRLVNSDSNGVRGSFHAHLAAVAGHTFINVYPEEPDTAANEYYRSRLILTHAFLLVDSIAPALQIRAMESDWLREYLAQHPDAIGHVEVDGVILITAPTEDLQRFVLQHIATEGAFSDPTRLIRQE